MWHCLGETGAGVEEVNSGRQVLYVFIYPA